MEKYNNIPENKNYSVPEDYFVDFQERLQVQIEFEELVGPSNASGFVVPDGYFSTVTEEITSKIQKPTKVVTLYTSKWMYAAASIAAIVILVLALRSTNTTGTFEDLESDTIASYLETEDSLLSAYDLGELFTDEELDELSNTIELEDTEVLEYLDITTDPYDLMIQ